MERLQEENKQLLQARDKEIATREGAEQKLAQVKSDLAKAQSDIENQQYYMVVCYMYMYDCTGMSSWKRYPVLLLHVLCQFCLTVLLECTHILVVTLLCFHSSLFKVFTNFIMELCTCK